ncbi:MAG: acetylglutamate kinase [Clostridia bacterium]|nr:acetylglutamate kinase [Clostridia bacterium]MDE6758358.1 acetylglutamate kinase [Clostridia bacterium]MDE7079373.1 acetylglutamate kinase [Clostridia bacterium]
MNNDLESAKQAEVLVSALPYIQKYNDKIIVVKYGGNAMLNEELKTAVMNDIVLLSLVGVKVVLVHGGGPEINDMLKRVGKESKFIGGLRYTDDETAEIVQMVLAGKVNKDLVKLLSSVGGKAVGFCGIDGNIISAKKKEGEVDLGNVGEIVDVDVDPILVTLENDYIPVIATVASGDDGKIYNINADTAAAAIASALHAENLVLMTDIRGLLMNKDDESTLISEIKVSEVPKLIKKGVISGGMIPKIDCVVEAVRRGVSQAVIIDGRIKHSIIMDMLTDKGIGTLIK